MHCLIIEDGLRVGRMLRDFIETRGHQVCVAETGQEGLRAAVEEMPGAIFLDRYHIVSPGDLQDVARRLPGMVSGISELSRLTPVPAPRKIACAGG